MCAPPTGCRRAPPASSPPIMGRTEGSNACSPSTASSARSSKPVLEINPTHPLIKSLCTMVGHADKGRLEDIIWLLFDEARLMEGEKPTDPNDFAARLTRILLKVAREPAA